MVSREVSSPEGSAGAAGGGSGPGGLPPVSPDDAAVLRLLEDGKQRFDRLIDETQLPAGRILSALTLLEVKGYVKRLPARYYELAKK